MDSLIHVVLVPLDDQTTRRHRCFFGRHPLPRVALRLLLFSLLCNWRAADLYLVLDQKQRLAFLSAFKLSARARRISACDAYHLRTAGDLAACFVGARSSFGSTRPRLVLSGSVGLIHTRSLLAIFRAHLFLLGWTE